MFAERLFGAEKREETLMKIQSKSVLLTTMVILAQSAFSAPASDSIYTPKPGSKERRAILRAVRGPVLKMTKRKVVTFTDVKMRANRNWAYVDATSVDSRRKPVGPEFTNELAALVRRHNGRWAVVEWAYATDVISMGWEKKYPQVPKRLWPHNR
jgi:hypothetical protein